MQIPSKNDIRKRLDEAVAAEDAKALEDACFQMNAMIAESPFPDDMMSFAL